MLAGSAVSSGVPEVNDYPFTTRGVAVGHIVSEEERFQVCPMLYLQWLMVLR